MVLILKKKTNIDWEAIETMGQLYLVRLVRFLGFVLLSMVDFLRFCVIIYGGFLETVRLVLNYDLVESLRFFA